MGSSFFQVNLTMFYKHRETIIIFFITVILVTIATLWVPITLPDESFSSPTFEANLFNKFSSRALFGTIVNIFSLNIFLAFLLPRLFNFLWLFLVIQYLAKETNIFCYSVFKASIIILSTGFLFAFNTNIFLDNVFPTIDPLARMLVILTVFFLFSEKNTNFYSYPNILAIIFSFSAVLAHEKSLFDICIISIWLFYKKGFKKILSYCLPLIIPFVTFIFLTPVNDQSILGIRPIDYIDKLMLGNSIEYLFEKSFNLLGILFGGGFLWPIFFMCVSTFIRDGLNLSKKKVVYRIIYSSLLFLLCLLPLFVAYDTNRLVALIWLPTVFLIVETNFLLNILVNLRKKIIVFLCIVLQTFIPPVKIYLHGAVPLNCYAAKSLNLIEKLQEDLNFPKYILLRNYHIDILPDVVDCYPIHLFRKERLKTFSPRDAKAYCNLGAAYNSQRMFDEAISECKKAIALSPNYAKAYLNLGSAYANKGMIDEAIVNFKEALTIKPKYAKAHYNLALAYYFVGNYELSIEYLDSALELGNNDNLKLAEQLEPYR